MIMLPKLFVISFLIGFNPAIQFSIQAGSVALFLVKNEQDSVSEYTGLFPNQEAGMGSYSKYLWTYLIEMSELTTYTIEMFPWLPNFLRLVLVAAFINHRYFNERPLYKRLRYFRGKNMRRFVNAIEPVLIVLVLGPPNYRILVSTDLRSVTNLALILAVLLWLTTAYAIMQMSEVSDRSLDRARWDKPWNFYEQFWYLIFHEHTLVRNMVISFQQIIFYMLLPIPICILWYITALSIVFSRSVWDNLINNVSMWEFFNNIPTTLDLDQVDSWSAIFLFLSNLEPGNIICGALMLGITLLKFNIKKYIFFISHAFVVSKIMVSLRMYREAWFRERWYVDEDDTETTNYYE